MNWCKLFGHKLRYYKEEVKHVVPSYGYGSSSGNAGYTIIKNHQSDYSINILTEFRMCDRCNTKQVRVAWTGTEKIDWENCDLSVSDKREVRLKELGL